MAKPAWVLEEQLKARHKRVKDVARLFQPVGHGGVAFVTLVDIAVLLLDMPDADWDRLVGLRRIEASIRRNARHQIKPAAEKPSQRKPGEVRGMRKAGETLEGLRAAREAHEREQAVLRGFKVTLVGAAAEPPRPLSEPGDGA